MFPCDTYRDVEITSYKQKSFHDLMEFTTFMLNASADLHKAQPPPDDGVDVKPMSDLYDFLLELLPDRYDEKYYLFNVAHWQLQANLYSDDLEPLCPKYASYPHPALQAIYMDRVLPDVYKMLAHCWTLTPFTLPEGKLEELGNLLMASIYRYPFPESYLSSAEPCAICLDTLYIERYTTCCHHSFHSRCLFLWLSDHNTCPACRNYIIY